MQVVLDICSKTVNIKHENNPEGFPFETKEETDSEFRERYTDQVMLLTIMGFTRSTPLS